MKRIIKYGKLCGGSGFALTNEDGEYEAFYPFIDYGNCKFVSCEIIEKIGQLISCGFEIEFKVIKWTTTAYNF